MTSPPLAEAHANTIMNLNCKFVAINEHATDDFTRIDILCHQAQAYASTRGSAPALSTFPLTSRTIPLTAPRDQAGATCNLWPRAMSTSRVISGMRASTDMSPGYIVCGKTEAGKLRDDQRGASIAC